MSEISSPAWRTTFGSGIGVFYLVGSLIIYILGSFASWRMVAGNADFFLFFYVSMKQIRQFLKLSDRILFDFYFVRRMFNLLHLFPYDFISLYLLQLSIVYYYFAIIYLQTFCGLKYYLQITVMTTKFVHDFLWVLIGKKRGGK